MATTTKFHQINQFVSRVERATNAAHLSWMEPARARRTPE